MKQKGANNMSRNSAKINYNLDIFSKEFNKQVGIVNKRREKIVKLFNQQGGTCPYCLDPMTLKTNHPKTATIDHIIPKARGGRGQQENSLASCQDCNSKKGSMSLAKFMLKMHCLV